MDCRPCEGSGEMSARMTPRERTETITRDLERLEVHYSLGVMNGTLRDAGQAERLFASIQRDVAALSLLVNPPATGPALNPAARITTLVDALEQLAIVRGNRLYQVDGLHECTTQVMPDDIRSYWHTAGPYKLVGHISHEPEVTSQLEARGILVWRGATDGLTRLVNANWLTSHAAIREHVMTKVIGRRCQFCRIQEPDTSRELSPVSPQQRGKLEISNGAVQLQTKQIHAHLKCIPHWQRWLAMAEGYRSQAEAESADSAAGRTVQALPALPDVSSDETQGNEPQHFNRQEQAQ